MKYLLLSFSTILGFFCVSCTSTEDRAVREASEDKQMKAVIIAFGDLKKAGALPKLARDAHGDLAVSPVSRKQRQERWYRNLVQGSSTCSGLYVADVELRAETIRYVFCADTRPPQLIASYVFDAQEWRELP